MELTLTPEELYEVTRKRRPSAQARELDFLGIEYRKRSDGTLMVLRTAVEPVHHRSAPEPRLRLA